MEAISEANLSTSIFNATDMPMKKDFTANFYGAIFGTAAAIAIMVGAFFFAPLFVAIPLLILGVLAIVMAYSYIGIVKGILLGVNNEFKILVPSQNGTITTLNVTHTTKDGVLLRGIFQESPSNNEKSVNERSLVIYFSGNFEKPYLLGQGSPNPDYARFRFAEKNAPFENHDILWFAYRGTGPSEGKFPTHQQNVSDAIEIYKKAQAEGYTNITFVGLSFGGKVASDAKAALLGEDSSTSIGLVACHTFHSMDEVISGNIEDSPKDRENIRNITKALLKTVGHQHDPVTAANWHASMGTKNVIIGGGRNDDLMNPHMALADVISPTTTEHLSDFEVSISNGIPKENKKFQNTRVIIQPMYDHGQIYWPTLTESVQEELR